MHNGIEFGMLQAIDEDTDLLSQFREKLDIQGILDTWNHVPVIRSWLIELLGRFYRGTGRLCVNTRLMVV